MIEQVAAAFERQDYSEVVHLLKAIPPEDPWNHLYQGRLSEVTGKLAAAEAIYRQLLQTATGSKIIAQARQGLLRLEKLRQAQRQQVIAQATLDDPSQAELGFLVLEAVPTEAKSAIAPKFAQIMQIDPYTARLQLPSRGWRLYRTGPVGELRFFSQALRAAGVPVFEFPLASILQVQVLQVCYFQSVGSQITAICEANQVQSDFTFQWAEVTQQVEGQLPIFEEVVDLDVRGRLQRKQKTQDYTQFCDLHLPGRRCILRIDDNNYQFQSGINLTSSKETIQTGYGTSRSNWKNLMGFLNQYLPGTPIWSDFTVFAEPALDHLERLNSIKSHINLFRSAESDWDQAFHIYSCLALLKSSSPTPF